PRPAPRFRRQQKALQELGRLVPGALRSLAPVPRQEQPGQGDVLELARVAEVVIDGQAMLTGPAESFTESALRDPDPGPRGRDRPHVREEVAHIEALRLVEQVERAAQISFGLPYPRHRHPPAVTVLRQPGLLAEFLASQQKLRGGLQVIALAGDLTHP